MTTEMMPLGLGTGQWITLFLVPARPADHQTN